eukprot:gene27763-64356_t
MYDPTLGAPLNADFGKPGLNESCPRCAHLDLRSTLVELWTAPAGCAAVPGRCRRFAARLRPPTYAHTDYGAPDEVWLRVGVPSAGARLNVTVDLYNKTPTRIPESSSVRFVPAPLAQGWAPRVSKLGRWVDPADVVLNGSRHLHVADDIGGVGLFEGGELLARVVAADAATACVSRYPT